MIKGSMLALLLLAACGGSGGSPSSGQYLDKCMVACRPPSGTPCDGQDPTACINECVAATNGLAAACAQCITEKSGFYGSTCASGCPCHFGVGSAGCTPTCPGYVCKPSDTQCDGYSIDKITDPDCAGMCP